MKGISQKYNPQNEKSAFSKRTVPGGDIRPQNERGLFRHTHTNKNSV
jgi:hypothetical protein|nr:MAG TPA: hypothetical protein [Caudoviricetes sp.]